MGNKEIRDKLRQNLRFTLPEIKACLELTEAEIKAIDGYQNQGYQTINTIMSGNMPHLDFETNTFSFGLNDNKKAVKNAIDRVVLLYSAMFKNYIVAQDRNVKRVHRGAETSITNESEKSFISTSLDRNEAIRWATRNHGGASKHYLLDISIEDDVMFLIMPEKLNEQEVLISPFVEVSKEENRWR